MSFTVCSILAFSLPSDSNLLFHGAFCSLSQQKAISHTASKPSHKGATAFQTWPRCDQLYSNIYINYLAHCLHQGNLLFKTFFVLKQDGAKYGSRVASSEKTLQFFVCFICFLLFYVLDVVRITVYNRHMLLNIGSSVTQRKLDFEFLNAGALFTDSIRTLCLGRSTTETQAEKREESWRPRQTETPCFPTSSSNHFAG